MRRRLPALHRHGGGPAQQTAAGRRSGGTGPSAAFAKTAHDRLHRDRRTCHPDWRLPDQKYFLQRPFTADRAASSGSMSTTIGSRRFSAALWSSAIPGRAVAATDTASMSSITTTSSMPCGANRRPCGVRSTGTACSPGPNTLKRGRCCSGTCHAGMQCRRMVDLLFIAHDQACEAELAHLLSADLAEGRLPDPEALTSRLTPRHMTLPRDVAVAHPSLDSFDALLGASA